MIVVYPISKHDVALADDLANAVSSLGNNAGHTAMVVHSPEVAQEAEKFASTIKERFDDVLVKEMRYNPYGGWPKASNQMFAFAAHEVLRLGQEGQWLWHEMDACPSRRGWADDLDAAYKLSDTPYFGFIKPTMFLYEDKRWEGDGSQYMSGVALYPNSIYQDIEAIKGIGRCDVAFDVFLRFEMGARGMGHCPLIAHRWRTSRWKWEGTMLAMENDPEGDVGIPREDPPQIVPDNVCLIHGCIDGSLARAISEDSAPVNIEKEVKVAPRRGRPPKVVA